MNGGGGEAGTREGRAQMGICPLLEKLEISRSRVTGEALKRMVASRLVEGEGRSRLKELDVSGWGRVRGASIKQEERRWLRHNVATYLGRRDVETTVPLSRV